MAMIKKLLLTLVVFIGMATTATAGETYVHDASVLPQAAQTILANNFKAKVSLVKIDKDFGRVSEYEVILTNGSEVKFDREGNWKNVEVSIKNSVPTYFVPKSIADYIKKNHPGQKVIGIEKNRGGYEVEITNGIEIKFNNQGEFRKYD